jgi:hypothetical protein
MAISLTSAGIVFTGTNTPAQSQGTGSAYTLDDYEEGTWTFGATGASSFTIQNPTADYTKTGRKVFFNHYTPINTNSPSGNAGWGGLPFTVKAVPYTIFQFVHGNAVDGSSTGGYLDINATTAVFVDSNSTGGATWVAGAKTLMIAGTYNAA